MIIRDKPGPLQLLFALRGSVLPRIAPQLLIVGISAALMVWWDSALGPLPHLSAAPFGLFGVALSLFLGFRNNAAYDRWWEARKLWGGLLADARSLAREAELFLAAPQDRLPLLRLMLAFLHLHRCALRGLAPDRAASEAAAAAGLTTPSPDGALTAMNTHLADALRAGRMDGFGARTLSARLSGIALAQAGCERIRATPLPYVYSLLIFRTTWLYVLLLPLSLLDASAWLTPLFAVIVAYTFLGLAEVTEELAHPFGLTANALPLDAICRSVEISLAPHLDQPTPPPLAPVAFRLD